ncbi:MAG: SPASM domain-containing protein [Magnetococcales bacterium]|nr:SPASM domain-containing protein [Magnetococcales bacterium]
MSQACLSLPDILPLPLPIAILIDPANACNFRCAFCPTGDLDLLKSIDRPKGVMDMGLYRRIIDGLADMVARSGRKLRRIGLYKDGEPLLNKHLPEMVAYAKQRQVAEAISITTNGSLLTRDRAVALLEAGLDDVMVSVEQVSDVGYRAVTRIYADYAAIIDNVRGLFEEKQRINPAFHLHVKIADTGLSPEERQRFERDFGPIADSLEIGQLFGWADADHKDFTMGRTPWRDRQARRVCPDPFSKLAINFDGQVSICCVDWSYGTVVGDLRRETIAQVWNGEALRRVRRLHLMGERDKIPACASCHGIMIKDSAQLLGLDERAEELLRLYE